MTGRGERMAAESQALLSVYDAAYSRDRWTEAMEACRRATGAAHTVNFVQGLNEEITFTVQGGSPTLEPLSHLFEDYNRKFRDAGVTGYDDVGAAFMHNAPLGQPVRDTDIWPLHWLRDREEVNFVRERSGVFRRLYVSTSSDPLLNGVVHFWYDEAHPRIPQADLATVATIGPHLAKAYDIARWADALRQRHQAVLSVLDKLEMGICITDESGRSILTNRHASDIFSDRDGIWCDTSGVFATPDSDLTAAIRHATNRIAGTSRGESRDSAAEFSVPRRGSDNPLLVIVSPLRDADMELERDLQGCLVTIVDTDRPADLRLDAFGAAYGLTATETTVAGLLVSGLTTPELGEEMGVARSTAQTHVKSVYHKTGATSRVNFVWRAIQFSPPVR